MKTRRRTGRSPLAQRVVCAASVALGISLLAQPVLARVHHHYVNHRLWHRAPARPHRAARAVDWGSPTDPSKDAELMLDGRTGRVLYARNADAQRHPASLTKMMTLYLLFDALKKGQVNMNTPVYISQHAAMQKPTKLGIRPGDWLPVDTAIRAAVVLSANDIAVAISEALGGTESHFAELMTQKAHDLGMRNTFYHNASGLPDDRQITTASDLGILARHLAYDFPQYFHYFSLPGFSFRGRVHLGHDNLLGRYEGADGIKTGYTNASGFNLVSSVVRNGVHIIGVVMGGYSAHRRDMEMVRLLDWTYAAVNARPMLVAHAEVPWQMVAQNTYQQPVIAGFQFSTGAAQPQSNMRQYASIAPGSEEDEEAAESRDSDEIAKLINNTPQPRVGAQQLAPQPQAPAPRVAAQQLAPQPQAPAPRVAAQQLAPQPQAPIPQAQPPAQPQTAPQQPPQIRTASAAPAQPPPEPVAVISAPAQVKFPDARSAPVLQPPLHIPNVQPIPRDNSAPILVASYEPSPATIPQVMPVPRSSVATDNRPGSIKVTTSSGVTPAKLANAAASAVAAHSWTIQIGAFNDVPSARAELAAYAEKSADRLGQAERIIVPYTGSDGKTMYRARFGNFAEAEARALCFTLTHEGHSCFASTLTH